MLIFISPFKRVAQRLERTGDLKLLPRRIALEAILKMIQISILLKAPLAQSWLHLKPLNQRLCPAGLISRLSFYDISSAK